MGKGKHQYIAAMLLYCHHIIWNDADKSAAIRLLAEDIKDADFANDVSRRFENKIMNYLAKETDIRGRKNMAILLSVILDPGSAQLLNLMER